MLLRLEATIYGNGRFKEIYLKVDYNIYNLSAHEWQNKQHWFRTRLRLIVTQETYNTEDSIREIVVSQYNTRGVYNAKSTKKDKTSDDGYDIIIKLWCSI